MVGILPSCLSDIQNIDCGLDSKESYVSLG